MAYFLRVMKKEKGKYLQICETIYDPSTKKSSNRKYQTLGYENKLINKEVSDPIKYYKLVVEDLNKKLKEEKSEKVSDKEPVTKNIGYFLINSVLNTLKVKDDLNMMGSEKKFQTSIYDFIRFMMFCQIIKPSSKRKNASEILPSLQDAPSISEDQIYRMINFVGTNYKKYIEIFNEHFEKNYGRKYKNVYFDCTNYYFEIDVALEDKQKGPSKENQKGPIIGQALLLDANQIPLAMEMYPGNESEKPYIRKLINEVKNKTGITSRTIQVADKGLNCARNIYFATKEANDGYVFSKSVHGKNLSEQERKWILLDNEQNIWHEIKDAKGNLLYKYKEAIDVFEYKFINDSNEKISFKQREKRVVSYNPDLAKKQILEINKEVEKVKKLNTIKAVSKSDYGDSIKYVTFCDNNGEIIDTKPTINYAKIEEDKSFAGYNLIVTSETNLNGKEIYDIYHGLWRIEESFRIMKYYLEARPAFMQTKESIYGHFLICYLCLFTIRILELKEFNDELTTYEIINYMRKFNLTKINEKFISNILMSDTLKAIQSKTGIATLDNAYLTRKNISNLLDYEF
jgi:hypothetical protein